MIGGFRYIKPFNADMAGCMAVILHEEGRSTITNTVVIRGKLCEGSRLKVRADAKECLEQVKIRHPNINFIMTLIYKE